jgi:AraC-like DNA-binding protein
MVAACLAPSAERLRQASPSLGSVLWTRAERFIEARLADPDLSAEQICAALRVSRSHLYRLFERCGGIANFIQARRIDKIHTALLDPLEARRISDLAYDYGFVSAAHFSRCFRRHLGYSPSEARASKSLSNGASSTDELRSSDRIFEAWL